MNRHIKTETPMLDVERELSWRAFRRYQRMFKGYLATRLTDEDDIVYVKDKHDKIVAWVRLIIPKSYA